MSTKPNKIKILSNIVLKPVRNTAQTLALPPLIPLSNTKTTNTEMVRTKKPSSNNRANPNSSMPNLEDSKSSSSTEKPQSKRKSSGHSENESPSKKSKSNDVKSDEGTRRGHSLVLNHTSSLHEKAITEVDPLKNTESPGCNADKQKHVTRNEGTAETLKPEQENKSENSTLSVEPNQTNQGSADKKPTETIDLTDDDMDANLNNLNKVFIQKIGTLQDALNLQNIRPAIAPIQNSMVLSPIKNLPSNVVLQNANPIFQNILNAGNLNSNMSQPVILVMQNNMQNFVVLPQSSAITSTPSANLGLISNNPTTKNNVLVADSSCRPSLSEKPKTITCLENLLLLSNQSPVKNVDKSFLPLAPAIPVISKPENQLPSSTSDIASKSSHNLPKSAQNSSKPPLNLKCYVCEYRTSIKKELILHMHTAHLQEGYQLNLKCKTCSFETDEPSVMEKHDLDHIKGIKKKKKLPNVSLSENVIIGLKKVEKTSNVDKLDGGDVDPVDVIPIYDSDDDGTKADQKKLTNTDKMLLQNHAPIHDQNSLQHNHQTAPVESHLVYSVPPLLNLKITNTKVSFDEKGKASEKKVGEVPKQIDGKMEEQDGKFNQHLKDPHEVGTTTRIVDRGFHKSMNENESFRLQIDGKKEEQYGKFNQHLKELHEVDAKGTTTKIVSRGFHESMNEDESIRLHIVGKKEEQYGKFNHHLKELHEVDAKETTTKIVSRGFHESMNKDESIRLHIDGKKEEQYGKFNHHLKELHEFDGKGTTTKIVNRGFHKSMNEDESIRLQIDGKKEEEDGQFNQHLIEVQEFDGTGIITKIVNRGFQKSMNVNEGIRLQIGGKKEEQDGKFNQYLKELHEFDGKGITTKIVNRGFHKNINENESIRLQIDGKKEEQDGKFNQHLKELHEFDGKGTTTKIVNRGFHKNINENESIRLHIDGKKEEQFGKFNQHLKELHEVDAEGTTTKIVSRGFHESMNEDESIRLHIDGKKEEHYAKCNQHLNELHEFDEKGTTTKIVNRGFHKSMNEDESIRLQIDGKKEEQDGQFNQHLIELQEFDGKGTITKIVNRGFQKSMNENESIRLQIDEKKEELDRKFNQHLIELLEFDGKGTTTKIVNRGFHKSMNENESITLHIDGKKEELDGKFNQLLIEPHEIDGKGTTTKIVSRGFQKNMNEYESISKIKDEGNHLNVQHNVDGQRRSTVIEDRTFNEPVNIVERKTTEKGDEEFGIPLNRRQEMGRERTTENEGNSRKKSSKRTDRKTPGKFPSANCSGNVATVEKPNNSNKRGCDVKPLDYIEIVAASREVSKISIVPKKKSDHIPNEYKCYFCSFVGSARYRLKRHLMQHFTFDFQCDIHKIVSKSPSCAMCSCKDMFKELERDFQICRDCGYKTLEKAKFARHLTKPNSCKYFQNRSMRESSAEYARPKRNRSNKGGNVGSTSEEKIESSQCQTRLPLSDNCSLSKSNEFDEESTYESASKDRRESLCQKDAAPYVSSIFKEIKIEFDKTDSGSTSQVKSETFQNQKVAVKSEINEEDIGNTYSEREESFQYQKDTALAVNFILNEMKSEFTGEDIGSKSQEDREYFQHQNVTTPEFGSILKEIKSEINEADIGSPSRERRESFQCQKNATPYVNSILKEIKSEFNEPHIGSTSKEDRESFHCQTSEASPYSWSVPQDVKSEFDGTDIRGASKETTELLQCQTIEALPQDWSMSEDMNCEFNEADSLSTSQESGESFLGQRREVLPDDWSITKYIEREVDEGVNTGSSSQENREYKDYEKLFHNIEMKPTEKLHNFSFNEFDMAEVQSEDDDDKNSYNDDSADMIDTTVSGDNVSKTNDKWEDVFKCFEKGSSQTDASAHSQITFQCSQHTEAVESCSECKYELCLLGSCDLIYSCAKCYYQTDRIQDYDNHVKNVCGKSPPSKSPPRQSPPAINLTVEQETSNEFKCLLCTFLTNARRKLKSHMVRHYGADFRCDIHDSVPSSTTCYKCVYQTLLKEAEQAANVCACGYKSLSKHSFDRHQAKKENCKLYKSRIMKASTEDNVEAEEDSQHENDARGTIRSSNRQESDAGGIIRSSNRQESDAGGTIRSSNKQENDAGGTIRSSNRQFKCFLCGLLPASQSALRYHVISHSNETFQCSDHPNNSQTGCDQCFFKDMLIQNNSKVLFCQGCGYRTMRKSDFVRHQRKPQYCKTYLKKRQQSEGNTVKSKKSVAVKKEEVDSSMDIGVSLFMDPDDIS